MCAVQRFDLIYLLLDKFDEEKDLRLARHLISLYHPGATFAARSSNGVVRACVCVFVCVCVRARVSVCV
jgi:DNA replicative helicase MCM subunit Mcm2 (Cdc46/Mcm family)